VSTFHVEWGLCGPPDPVWMLYSINLWFMLGIKSHFFGRFVRKTVTMIIEKYWLANLVYRAEYNNPTNALLYNKTLI
jgi:hypothetical protein